VTVTLIDYGAGNITSVWRALRRLGAKVECADRPEEIVAASCLVLPGVGHCGALISSLDARGLREPLLEAISRGTPFLGICLGLQALYDSSDEAPRFAGLGLLKGRVTQLPPHVKLPHMGWNQLLVLRASRLLDGISPEAYFRAWPRIHGGFGKQVGFRRAVSPRKKRSARREAAREFS